nr:MAG TPA: hypothetical protein [Caudoviricetes sp.]
MILTETVMHEKQKMGFLSTIGNLAVDTLIIKLKLSYFY